MLLINRSAHDTIFVRGFSSGDTTHGIGVGDASKIAPGSTVNISMAQNPVQLEVKYNWPFGAPIIAADKSRLFDSNSTVIYTAGSQLVELKQELQWLMGMSQSETSLTNQPSQLAVDFARVSTAILALLEGLVSGYAPAGMAKGVGVGTVKMASVLVGIFANQSSLPSLKLDDIKDSLGKVIDEHDAGVRASYILDATTWFDKYVQKSQDRLKTATDPAGIDLSEFDRKEFEKELQGHLDELTPFLPALGVLSRNRNIRKYVIPEYILGVSLYLQLRRIELILKQLQAPLDSVDISSIKKRAELFYNALQESEEDFVAMRKNIIQTYPLVEWEGHETWYDDFYSYSELIPPQPEADKLRRGLVFKYLNGDRKIIEKAKKAIDDTLTNLEKIKI